jgi:rubredoxin
LKTAPIIFLIIALITTFGFITGFVQEDTDAAGPEEINTIKWVCPYCGYVYDPAIEGVTFETLADDWTCPVCNSLKSGFVKGEEYGEYIASDPWIAHLQHVLAMRSKHLVVLQRVIESHMAKYVGPSSISGLENAFISSSKSVLKAKAEINSYLEFLSSPEVTIDEKGDEGNTEDEEGLLNSEDGGNEDAANGNGNENNGNKDEKENKEQTNNGKALGKNK